MGEDPKTSQEKRIWYASYGSNLSKNRFLCYIRGGIPPGAKKKNEGSRTRTLPLDDQRISLDFELYFAAYAHSWRGSPAFIKPSYASQTIGRMYLITDDQFNDVVLQENGKEVDGSRMLPAFEQLCKTQDFLLPDSGLYGRLLKVGEQRGYPIFTFTASRNDLKIGAPSEPYVKVIAAGIKETYPELKNTEICEYLGRCSGVAGIIPIEKLQAWIDAA